MFRSEPIGPKPAPRSSAAHPLVIEPWISTPPDVLVYEFGARLDEHSKAAAFEQVQKARLLYNALVGCIRTVHEEMQAWVLERSYQARAPRRCRISSRRANARSPPQGLPRTESERILAPQRIALGAELTGLLRPARQRHRAELRELFFARVGNTLTTQTYRLRCKAVDEGLGWATATAVLDSALLAWKRSLVFGRAPQFASADRKDQDALIR